MKKILPALFVLCVSLFVAPCAVAGRLVVAADGSGNFTSIGAALDAIAPNASNPYVIDVMPGRYTGSVKMKSHVHLRGSGPDVTVLDGATLATVIQLVDVRDATISGVTIQHGLPAGIFIARSRNVAIKDCKLANNSRHGMVATETWFSRLSDCIVSSNGSIGVYARASGVDLENNEVRENGADGVVLIGAVGNSGEALGRVTNNRMLLNNGDGLRLEDADVFVTNNRVYYNRRDGIGFYRSANVIAIGNHIAQNDRYGAYITSSAKVRLTHNHLYDNTRINSPTPRADIFIDDANVGAWMPMISYNVYDRLIGTKGNGAYNTNIDGAPVPNP